MPRSHVSARTRDRPEPLPPLGFGRFTHAQTDGTIAPRPPRTNAPRTDFVVFKYFCLRYTTTFTAPPAVLYSWPATNPPDKAAALSAYVGNDSTNSSITSGSTAFNAVSNCDRASPLRTTKSFRRSCRATVAIASTSGCTCAICQHSLYSYIDHSFPPLSQLQTSMQLLLAELRHPMAFRGSTVGSSLFVGSFCFLF